MGWNQLGSEAGERRYHVSLPLDVDTELPAGLERELLLIEVFHAFEKGQEANAFVETFLTLIAEGYSAKASWWMVRESAVRATLAQIRG